LPEGNLPANVQKKQEFGSWAVGQLADRSFTSFGMMVSTLQIIVRRGMPRDSHCRGNDVVCRENEKKTARPQSTYEFEELLLAAPFSFVLLRVASSFRSAEGGEESICYDRSFRSNGK